MPLKRYTSFVFFCLFFMYGVGQEASPISKIMESPAHLSFDSIITSLGHIPKLDFRFDTRNSFVTNNYARITGIKVGFEFNRTVRIGLGYNWLSTNIYKIIGDQTGRLTFNYFTPYFEYAFFRNHQWELGIPVHIGIGRAGYRFDLFKKQSRTVLLYEPYMVGQYKIFSWFGVGFGVGYRLIFAGSNALDQNFNSPMYILKANLFPGVLFRKVVSPQKPESK